MDKTPPNQEFDPLADVLLAHARSIAVKPPAPLLPPPKPAEWTAFECVILTNRTLCACGETLDSVQGWFVVSRHATDKYAKRLHRGKLKSLPGRLEIVPCPPVTVCAACGPAQLEAHNNA